MLNADAIHALLRMDEGETLEFKERFGTGVIETAVPAEVLALHVTEVPLKPVATRGHC